MRHSVDIIDNKTEAMLSLLNIHTPQNNSISRTGAQYKIRIIISNYNSYHNRAPVEC